MELHAVDWAIIVGYFAISLGIGLWFTKKSGESLVEYFASGRSMPWWLAGTSMVATTFAADTPLAVTGFVAKNGLAGNWFWWAFAFGGMLTVFVFAKLWRRANVLTDVELIEMRYAGPPAAFLRGFRAVYVAVVVNSFVIGWVTTAMVTVLRETVLKGAPTGGSTDVLLIAGMLAITGVYCILSGMWGVAVTDAFQFVLAMGGCIALAWLAVDAVGGVDALQERAAANFGGTQLFDYVPDFSSAAWMPLGVFLALVLGQWWATWYPGAEPGGGGYIVQRMASCRNERDAVKATLLFQLAHYCIRPWPWIIVAFAALALHPELRTYALADKSQGLPTPDAGFPMLIRELAPTGLRGLLLVTFFAAYMSTISTQMNWGASYVVNDVYKRFVAPGAGDAQLVRMSRWASALVLVLGGATSWAMIQFRISPDEAWGYLAALGGGLGSVFMLRWFWWRINAWSEIAAMLTSLVMFVVLLIAPLGIAPQYTALIVATVSIVAWTITTFLTDPEPREHLVAFYRRIRPDGPGWAPIAAAAPEVRPDGGLGRAIVCAVLGTTVIWLCLPGIGAVIFGELGKAALCLGGAAIAAALMLRLATRGASAADRAG
jgi:solute:Na+ symporter, SSS family